MVGINKGSHLFWGLELYRKALKSSQESWKLVNNSRKCDSCFGKLIIFKNLAGVLQYSV